MSNCLISRPETLFHTVVHTTCGESHRSIAKTCLDSEYHGAPQCSWQLSDLIYTTEALPVSLARAVKMSVRVTMPTS